MKQRAKHVKGVPLALASAFLLLCLGCAGDQANRQDLGAIAAARLALAEPLEAENRPPVIVEKPVPDPRIEAVQQSLTGLGLQFNKVADEASLAKVSATLTAKAVEDFKASLDVKLTNHQSATATALGLMLNEWKVEVTAQVRQEVRAEFEAQLEARNQQLAAWQATVSEQRQEIKAQRDAYVQQIQYTAEMRDKDIASYEAMVAGAREQGYVSTGLVSILALLIGRIVHRLSKTIVEVDHDDKQTKRLGDRPPPKP